MQADIRLHLSELSETTIAKIKAMLGLAVAYSDPEIVISVNTDEKKREYYKKLEESLRQGEEGKVVTFTMKELEDYIEK